MTHSIRNRFALLAVLAAGFTPSAARAASPARPASPTRSAAEARPAVIPASSSTEGLTPQQEQMLALAQNVARQCEAAIERWISAKETTSEKLFNFLYYPVPDTDPPKFTTDWDRLADRDIQSIEEEALGRSQAILFVVLVDVNGYLPTHNLKFSQPLTGNRGNDLVNNRTKRIFIDRTGLAAARNKATFFLQSYTRDTGEVMMDLSVPVKVQGAHWGAVRIGYRPVDPR